MALPINIEDLLNKNKLESNRIEFKSGWNPGRVYRSIGAFAKNGSPAAFIETSPKRLFCVIHIPIHPDFKEIIPVDDIENDIENDVEKGTKNEGETLKRVKRAFFWKSGRTSLFPPNLWQTNFRPL